MPDCVNELEDPRLLSHVNRTILRVGHAGEDLMGVAEVATYLAVSRQRVDALVRTKDRFPRPVAALQAGRVWRRSDIEEWARAEGRAK